MAAIFVTSEKNRTSDYLFFSYTCSLLQVCNFTRRRETARDRRTIRTSFCGSVQLPMESALHSHRLLSLTSYRCSRNAKSIRKKNGRETHAQETEHGDYTNSLISRPEKLPLLVSRTRAPKSGVHRYDTATELFQSDRPSDSRKAINAPFTVAQ